VLPRPAAEEVRQEHNPEDTRRDAEAAGWLVPGFTVEQYRDRLCELPDQIRTDGPFVAHATRMLVEARKPA
jgi:hypothetical protein